MRALMPEIERQIADGVHWDDVIAALNAGGLEVSRETFKSYLYRYRRDRRSANASPISVEQNTDRNTGPDTGAMEDGNPPLETPEPEPDNVTANEPSLGDILDPRKRDAITDRYMQQKPTLIGKKRSESK